MLQELSADKMRIERLIKAVEEALEQEKGTVGTLSEKPHGPEADERRGAAPSVREDEAIGRRLFFRRGRHEPGIHRVLQLDINQAACTETPLQRGTQHKGFDRSHLMKVA